MEITGRYLATFVIGNWSAILIVHGRQKGPDFEQYHFKSQVSNNKLV